MLDLVTAFSRGTPLEPVAMLRTRRHGVRVRTARKPIADVVIDGVEVLHGGRVVSRFRELEAELTGGDESDLAGLEKTLRAAGAGDADGRPKLFRALDIRPRRRPSPTRPRPPPSTSAR